MVSWNLNNGLELNMNRIVNPHGSTHLQYTDMKIEDKTIKT